MTLARTCSCGRRVEPGHTCTCGATRPPMSEKLRNIVQPYRKAYADPTYRRNRKLRYELAQGRCESCGVPLKGGWQCHHVLEVTRFAQPEHANVVENLRCYCQECHRLKTAASRNRRSD